MDRGDEGATAAPDPILPEAVCDAVDELRIGPLTVSALSGGLTNRNFKVVTPGPSLVVRISDPASGSLAIDRDNEYRNSVIAAGTGVGAPVYGYVPEANALVIGFLEGRTLCDEDFARPDVLDRVAVACRRLHDGPAFVNEFDMFVIQSGYLRTVLDAGYRLPADYLDYAPMVERIRGALAVRAGPTVACNNDLLAGNFIDDGRTVRLIDYEYSGNNDACFELGNLWSECHLSSDQLEYLMTGYYGSPLRNKIARARLLGLIGQYGWTLWASIQEATSPLDFAFWPWGMEKYERAVATFRSADLDRLIEDVQRTD